MPKLPPALSEKLIRLYIPRGVKVQWKRKPATLAHCTDKGYTKSPCKRLWRPAWVTKLPSGQLELVSPYPDTPFAALVFLHECAHLATGAFRHEQANHIEEYNAERTAMGWWRSEGQSVPRLYLADAKRYVRDCIKADRKRKRPKVKIVKHIQRWAKK